MSTFQTIVPVVPVVAGSPTLPPVVTYAGPMPSPPAWPAPLMSLMSCACCVLLVMYWAGRATCERVLQGWQTICVLLLAVSLVAYFASGGDKAVPELMRWQANVPEGYAYVDGAMVRADLLGSA